MRAAVLGAGALGTLAALNLARGGSSVDLVERRGATWSGASVAGEGKVHLGYVYGRGSDASLCLLLEGASQFGPAVEAALGRRMDWPALVSSPFDYLVADTSPLSGDDFERHAARMSRLASERDLLTDGYLGNPMPELGVTRVRAETRGTTYATPERSVDVVALRAAIDAALADEPLVRCLHGATVAGVERSRAGWSVDVAGADGPARLGPYDAVLNCTWESAAHIDHLAGVDGVEVPNLRLRAFLHGRSSGDPMAVTITHGPYGDMVRFPGGRTYASWYPTGLLGFDESRRPPAAWAALQGGVIDDAGLVASMVEGLAQYVPDVEGMVDVRARARVVVARGSTDIDDPGSRLHDRSDARVSVDRGWVSVRSPKLTTAPLLARRAAEAVADGWA